MFLFLKANIAAFLIMVLTLPLPTLAIDDISFGTTSTHEELSTEEASTATAKNGRNEIIVEFISNVILDDGGNIVFEGEGEGAAEIFKSMQATDLGRQAMMGLVYGRGDTAIENRYRDLQNGDRKSIDSAVNDNNMIVRALTVAVTDPATDHAKTKALLASIEGYAAANAYLLSKLGKTEIVETEDKPTPFHPEKSGFDLSDLIVFAGIVILLWIASGKVLSMAKDWKEKRDTAKAAKASEAEEMAEALREKRAAAAVTATPRRRNRNRNRNRNATETAETAEAVEA